MSAPPIRTLLVDDEMLARLAIRQAKVALGTLQRLDVRLLVNGEDDRILRRVEVERDDLGCLRSELRVRADAPGATALELDTVLAEHAPDLVCGDISQRLGEQPAIPRAIAIRRRLIQPGKDALLNRWAIRRRTPSPLLVLEAW